MNTFGRPKMFLAGGGLAGEKRKITGADYQRIADVSAVTAWHSLRVVLSCLFFLWRNRAASSRYRKIFTVFFFKQRKNNG
jgi:hypothetical protein